MQVYKKLGWLLLTALGALALGVIAVSRGEPINAVWLMLAAGCVFALARRSSC
jgi:carbon starvation protein